MRPVLVDQMEQKSAPPMRVQIWKAAPRDPHTNQEFKLRRLHQPIHTHNFSPVHDAFRTMIVYLLLLWCVGFGGHLTAKAPIRMIDVQRLPETLSTEARWKTEAGVLRASIICVINCGVVHDEEEE